MFVASTAYYVRVTMYREPHWFGWHPVVRPFFVGGSAEIGQDIYPRISFLISAPYKAGLKEGDVLLEVNGRKVTGSSVVGEVLRNANDGDSMIVKVARFAPNGTPSQAAPAADSENPSTAKTKSHPQEITASFRLTSVGQGRWLDHLSQAALLIFLPLFQCS